jgi:hypothetical protein
MIDRIIAPAILATTFEDFKNSIQKIEHLFPYAHIDVMDGKFVPSISFQDIERINDLETEMEFELHLMVREPLREMEKWTLIKNVIRVIFHIETISDPTDCIAFVKQHWPQVGLALNPETPLSAIEPYINQVNAIQFMTVLRGGIPKLVLMAEFAADSADEARDMARDARAKLMDLSVQTRLAANEAESEKFWKIRREAFALLRKNMKGLYAAPFIDDFVVHPKDYPAFLPKLIGMLKEYGFIFAITGHIGNGNFHIFPMLALDDPKTPAIIRDLSKRVYTLVGEYHGSITGEHNDGIIRTPYLPMMFPPKMLELFAEVKRLFDPHDIFNPGKKVGMTEDDIGRFMRKS